MLKYFANIEEVVSSFFLGLMTIVITTQVIFRYCISYSLAWPEELGRYLFIASVYIGSSYVEQQQKHLAITILRTSGGKWCKRWLSIVAQIITTMFCLLMTVWGAQMVLFMYKTGQLAPAIEIPMYIAYLSIPVGMAGMTVRSLINVKKQWQQNNTHYNTFLQSN